MSECYNNATQNWKEKSEDQFYYYFSWATILWKAFYDSYFNYDLFLEETPRRTVQAVSSYVAKIIIREGYGMV